LTQEEALDSIGKNFEILLLLMGMMMVVEIMSKSGIFQWLAIKVAQVAKGDPIKILILLSLVTSICSAFLDNVTTILLILPVSILLAKRLKINLMPFILVPIFACNIAGTATMIGDPPNLIIASAGNLTFNNFLFHVAPIVIINLIVLIITALLLFRNDFNVSNELRASIMDLEPNRSITDKSLLIKSCVLFFIIILGFITNIVTNIGLAIISIGGSIILLLLSKKSAEEIYQKIEWETLFFFGGLFVLIDGIGKIGIISIIGNTILNFTHGNVKLTSYVILIISSIISPILGSVPYTISFSKVIQEMTQSMNNAQILWWALSLGACLGGNMTTIGAPANIVGISIAEKADVKINFLEFFKYGFLVVLESITLSFIYIYIRY
ncbi:MAG: anion permease, partial [Fusobacteriaceae bacterium]|nr:anion permease [Fusobacteriaceae bacterium]